MGRGVETASNCVTVRCLSACPETSGGVLRFRRRARRAIGSEGRGAAAAAAARCAARAARECVPRPPGWSGHVLLPAPRVAGARSSLGEQVGEQVVCGLAGGDGRGARLPGAVQEGLRTARLLGDARHRRGGDHVAQVALAIHRVLDREALLLSEPAALGALEPRAAAHREDVRRAVGEEDGEEVVQQVDEVELAAPPLGHHVAQPGERGGRGSG